MTRHHLIYKMFELSRERLENYAWKDKNILPLLTIVLKVFALKQLIDDHHELLITGYFDGKQVKLLRDAYKSILVTLRPHMVPLVEFSPKSEVGLLSSIGNRYGDIYEKSFDHAV